MPPAPPTPPNPVQFAAFKLRFRALRIDATICLALFLIGGIVAGIVLENRVGGRVAAFAIIVTAILTYEPWMVARYGGTFGHQRSNIRIVCKDSGENLPIWRAAVRSLVKQLFGLPSFLFMFVTTNAQGLHDLLADSRVILRDPLKASETDRFDPTPPPAG